MSNASTVHHLDSSERERMHDVQILLNNLFRREEATVLMILDCLYDVGSKRLIHRRIQFYKGQQLMEATVRPIKPLFKAIALPWFKRNVPKLLADWLHTQVMFEPEDVEPEVQHKRVEPLVSQTLDLGDQQQVVKRLQQQVRVLMGVSIGAIATLIGTLIS